MKIKYISHDVTNDFVYSISNCVQFKSNEVECVYEKTSTIFTSEEYGLESGN